MGDKLKTIKFYFMQLCGILSLLSILLPWLSYGVGSKTGLDVARLSLYVILISGAVFLVFSYVFFKINKGRSFYLYLVFISSFIMFISFLYELIRIAYQTHVAKNLPVEMFGAATLTTAKIHIGYGLWIGVVASLLPCIVNLIVIKKK